MSKITVARVYRITDGSALVTNMSDVSPANGGSIQVEAHTDFDPADDGETRYVVIDSETIAFTDVDEATDELLNITRAANGSVAAAHTPGTFVQAGLTARSEKFADGFIDDDEALAQGVEILRHLWSRYPVGQRDHDEMEVATVRYLDDGHPIIVDAPEDERADTPTFFSWSRTGTIATGTRPHRWPAPFGGALGEFVMTLGEGGEADDDVIVDILKDGVSILTEKLTIPAGEWLSNAVAPTTPVLERFDVLQVQFEQVGVTDKGANPTIVASLFPSDFAASGRIEVRGPQGIAGTNGTDGADGADGLISQIRDEGIAVTDAGALDFTGAGVGVTSDGTVVTVDIPGGAGGGAMEEIASTRLGASAASIQFSSIPGTYKHLLLVVVGKTTDTNPQNILMRFNGDSGNNYHWQLLQGNGTTASASSSASTSSIIPASALGSGQASRATAYTISIPEYAQTNFHKNAISNGGRIPTDLAAGHIFQTFYGHWKSTAAITSITLTLGAGNFDVGTIVTLYGMS